MNNIMIENTLINKHLGLTFFNTCNWTEHISNIAANAWFQIELMAHTQTENASSWENVLLENNDF